MRACVKRWWVASRWDRSFSARETSRRARWRGQGYAVEVVRAVARRVNDGRRRQQSGAAPGRESPGANARPLLLSACYLERELRRRAMPCRVCACRSRRWRGGGPPPLQPRLQPLPPPPAPHPTAAGAARPHFAHPPSLTSTLPGTSLPLPHPLTPSPNPLPLTRSLPLPFRLSLLPSTPSPAPSHSPSASPSFPQPLTRSFCPSRKSALLPSCPNTASCCPRRHLLGPTAKRSRVRAPPSAPLASCAPANLRACVRGGAWGCVGVRGGVCQCCVGVVLGSRRRGGDTWKARVGGV